MSRTNCPVCGKRGHFNSENCQQIKLNLIFMKWRWWIRKQIIIWCCWWVRASTIRRIRFVIPGGFRRITGWIAIAGDNGRTNGRWLAPVARAILIEIIGWRRWWLGLGPCIGIIVRKTWASVGETRTGGAICTGTVSGRWIACSSAGAIAGAIIWTETGSTVAGETGTTTCTISWPLIASVMIAVTKTASAATIEIIATIVAPASTIAVATAISIAGPAAHAARFWHFKQSWIDHLLR